MSLERILKKFIVEAIKADFNRSFSESDIDIIINKTEYQGQFTFVSFNIAKKLDINSSILCKILEEVLVTKKEYISGCLSFNGFLNIDLSSKIFYDIVDIYSSFFSIKKINFLKYLEHIKFEIKNEIIALEFPSPNTNKPLHLGHLRNIFIGTCLTNILKSFGKTIYIVNLINNRGIHICKSMIAYLKYGNKETPKSAHIKGDHLIGKYYVLFEKKYREELNALNIDNNADKKEPLILKEAKDLLNKWENGDKETLYIWNKLNDWVYKGFDETFNRLNLNFSKVYYESDTYLLGKKIVQEGLEKNIFYKKEDGSVWVNLTNEGLDEKIILRADGTSVYITQDMGSADQRYDDFKFDKSIYIVGNEQNYHFKVLFEILKKFNRKFANSLFHLSYGMVDLPDGKMKSREGNVIDADFILDDMIDRAKRQSMAHNKSDFLSEKEYDLLHEQIGIGALKYFLLKVDSKKRILFNPQESIDFQGDTGPFLQYTHARIKNLLKKNKTIVNNFQNEVPKDLSFITSIEKKIILHIYVYKDYIIDAFNKLEPSIIAQYAFSLAKYYSKFYTDINILHEKENHIKIFRLRLSKLVGNMIKFNLNLLGIDAPDSM